MNQMTSILDQMRAQAERDNRAASRTWDIPPTSPKDIDTQAPIIDVLKRRGPMTNRQICDALHVSQQTMSNRIGRLMRSGKITATKGKVDYSHQPVNFYSVAEEGK